MTEGMNLFSMLSPLIGDAHRQIILMLLAEPDGVHVDALAERIGITVSGARQHTNTLQRAGVLRFERVRRGPGRPIHIYKLKPELVAALKE